MTKHRSIISTNAAPAAIGPYSQAVATRELVFASGQIPIEPQSGKLVEGDIAAETKQCMNNLSAVLQASGSDISRSLKITIFLTDMALFPAVNKIYASYFEQAPPARACVAVSALPMGARIEIEAIAMR